MKKSIYFFAIAAFGLFSTSVMAQNSTKTYVIDAGHGGFDKGSNNGSIVESEYSLELAQKIQQLAKKKNQKSIQMEHLDIQVHLQIKALANQVENMVKKWFKIL